MTTREKILSITLDHEDNAILAWNVHAKPWLEWIENERRSKTDDEIRKALSHKFRSMLDAAFHMKRLPPERQ